jgi:hypothetical protein
MNRKKAVTKGTLALAASKDSSFDGKKERHWSQAKDLLHPVHRQLRVLYQK